jgi:ADP-ribose pyrophosphatase
MVPQKWETLESSVVFSAGPWFTISREAVRIPDGRTIEDYYRIQSPDFTKVVAVTPEGKLVLVSGYQHGPRAVTLQAPGGVVEPGESPLEAHRELFEETGYRSHRWEGLGSFVVDGNKYYSTSHIFLARDALPAGAATGDGVEDLETVLLSPEEFLDAVGKGGVDLFTTVGTVCLGIAALRKESLVSKVPRDGGLRSS